MVEVVVAQDYEVGNILFYFYFKNVLGLCGKGLDPRKFNIDEFAIEANCVKLWGPRKGHNGFKFKVDGNLLEVEAKIKQLNGIIYQRGQANIAICLSFAKGIVVEREGAQVN